MERFLTLRGSSGPMITNSRDVDDGGGIAASSPWSSRRCGFDRGHRHGRRRSAPSLATVPMVPTVPTGMDNQTSAPNVKIFDPTMSTVRSRRRGRDRHPAGPESVRRRAVLAVVQARNLRTSEEPLNFEVGYYTSVAGLGLSPNDAHQRIGLRPQSVRREQFCTPQQLLAVVVEPDHQRDQPRFRLLLGSVLGGVAGRADAPGARQGQTTLMDYCTAPRSPMADSSRTRNSTARSSTVRSSNGSPGTVC